MDDSIIETAILKTMQKVDELSNEKKQLEQRLAEVEQEIAMLRPKMAALTNLLDDEPSADSPIGQFLKQLEQMGLTDAVREVLKASGSFMTPVEVRDALIKMGYDINKYGNIVASIHTILKRLLNAGNLAIVLRETDGKVGYRWDITNEVLEREARKAASKAAKKRGMARTTTPRKVAVKKIKKRGIARSNRE